MNNYIQIVAFCMIIADFAEDYARELESRRLIDELQKLKTAIKCVN